MRNAPPLTPESLATSYIGEWAKQHLLGKTIDISIWSVYNDKRRESTVRRMLVSQGLIPDMYQLNNPDEEKIREVGAPLARFPEFSDGSALKREYGSYGGSKERPLKNRFEAYRDIRGLKDEEAIYVWLHISEFDFQTITQKSSYRNKHYGAVTTVHEVQSLYPKALLETVESGVFKGKMKKYLLDHIGLGLELITGEKCPNLTRGHSTAGTSFSITDPCFGWDKEFNNEKVLKEIEECKENIAGLQQTLIELGVLQIALAKAGSYEALMESMLTAFHEHLRRKAACYINSEDKDLKALSSDVLNGADRGDLQDVSPVITFGQ